MNLDQKNFLFTILDFVPMGIVVLNEDFQIVSWNHTLSIWSAMRPGEVEGKNIFDIFPHLNSPKYIERFEHVFEGSPPAFFSSKIHKFLIPCPIDEDEYRSQNCTFSRIPMRDDNLNKMGLLSILDVTDLNKNIVAVKNASRLKEEFFNICSHDLRSPLNAIIGLSDVMKSEDNTEEELKEYVDVINDSGQMMLELINNLLDLGKIGKVEHKTLKEVDFNHCLMSSIKVHRYLATKKNIKLSVKLEKTQIFVKANEYELIRVLNNLISNAIKFTSKNGHIDLELMKENGHAKFLVRDSGVGMSEDQLKHLFKKYNKGQRVGTDGEIGTGLGLSIGHQIIKSFGGTISVSSEIGKGSIFVVTLPLLKEI